MLRNYISHSDATELISNKKEFYKGMLRNGFRMPDLDQAITTWEFMKGVREMKVYCPMYVDLCIRPCPDPPKSEDVQNEVIIIIQNPPQQFDQQLYEPYRRLCL